MTPEEWEKVSEIYHAAKELEPDAVARFLSAACDGNEAIRKEVESLIAADDAAGNFISEPIVGNFAKSILDSEGPSPDDLVGHYRVVSKIGSGGMGEVFHAIDTKLGRDVAIKTLSSVYNTDPSFLKRFKNEARAAATLNHPNVATVYSVEEFNGFPVIAMEFVAGQTLDRLTDENGLEIGRFLDWFEPISDALSHAHRRGIIHRDIKPGNIMISVNGTPKILDFGLAQFERPNPSPSSPTIDITAPGQLLGTPSYMSPEQAAGSQVDKRSDIFSFGVVMYEALTGKRPFGGPSQGAIVQSVIHDRPAPITDHRPDLPPFLSDMVHKCLEKSPQRRFQSFRQIRSVLKDAKLELSAGGSKNSFARRLYREASSPPRLWLPAVAILTILSALGGWYYFSTQRPNSPFGFAEMTIRKLSQSNNVAFAAIAPDGRSVVYVTYETNGDRALWLRRVSDANAINVVAPQPVLYWDCPRFSNDGEYIYYITATRAATHGTMYRVPTLGGQPRKLIEKVNHLGNLSPDGQRILFVRYGDVAPNLSTNTAETRLMSANATDGSDESTLVTVGGESILREPRYSADGKNILYSKRELIDEVEWWSIISANLDGADAKEIVRQRERIGEIAVLSGANGLLVNANDPASNRRQLYHVSLPDGTMSRITNDINSYVGVSVDLAGRNIVAAQRSDDSRIWVGEGYGYATAKPFARDVAARHNVDWTPDGRLVYDTIENNRTHVWIADVDGKNALRLTPDDSDDFDPRVSGDGRYIVFTSRRAGFNQIWRMNIDGSGQTLLANVSGITQYPRFEPDGETVVFRWFNEGASPLGRVNVNGGNVEGIPDLPKAVTYYWATSPDGKTVAYTETDQASGRQHVVMKILGGNPQTKVLAISPSRIFKWMPDGRSILYQEIQSAENPGSKLFEIDPDEGNPKLLFSFEPDEIFDFTFSRDKKKFAMVRGKTSSDAVILSLTTTK